MTPKELVSLYQSYGFRLLYWKRKPDPDTWKGPREEGWNDPEKVYDLTKYDPETDNIGVFVGHEVLEGFFLIDFDLDCDHAAALAQTLLPESGFGFGRESRKLTHLLYTTNQRLASIAWKDIDNKTSLLELRAGNSTHETMLPPSIHPSGEVVILRGDEPPTHLEFEEALRQGRNLAIACLVDQWLPGGFHHDARLAFCGTVLRLGMTPEDTLAIGLAICRVQGTDQMDMKNALASTVSRLAGKTAKVSGGNALAKLIGEKGKEVVGRIREWMGRAGESENDVVMKGGDIISIVNRAELALLAGPAPIYQRGGFLTRPIKLSQGAQALDAARRESNTTVLVPVREAWLVEEMARVLNWFVLSAKGDRKPADPKDVYARTLLERREWKFPLLRGIVTAPTLTRNGRIVDTSGYDEGSGLLLDFDPAEFGKVPERPTEEDAREALERLAHPLRGFPFVDDAARSVALSAILTALVRCSLRTAPLHSFDAPTAGTGKSLLAELVGIIATGSRPPALSQGKSPEEDEKRLSTVLFAGDPIIHLDNCERPVTGDFLCSMLTQEIVQSRILGLSERRVLPSTALVLASGNNILHAGDTSRRAVICRLDAAAEKPETRKFDFDCHEEALQNRSQLVIDGLTILKAYRDSGYHADLIPMGGFNDWEWIRGALVWLGCADPAQSRDSIIESDPKKDELIEIMSLWEAAFGTQRFVIADVTTERANDLHHKFIEVACRGVAWNAKSVGWWLRRNKDRPINGKAFKCATANNKMEWWLEGAEQREEGTRIDGVDHTSLPM